MTIWYPDVSNHEGAMPLQAGTVAVCAKASEGTTFVDAQYGHFKAEAQRVGAVFFGYHFLHAGAGAAQASVCHGIVGSGVNVMIDFEPTGTSAPSLQDALDFAAVFRRLGGLCTLIYLPHWYWQQLGSPSLTPLAAAGLSVVSSDYTTYSDVGPGWAAYGGVAPVIWQYTDALVYSGQSVDFNAYRGTVDQLRSLLGYTAAPGPAPASGSMEVLPMQFIANAGPEMGEWFWDDGKYVGIASPADLQALQSLNVPTISVSVPMHQRLVAAAAPAPTATVTIDPAGFVAALTQAAPAAAAAIAHALAVQEHNDTPGS